MWLVTDLNVIFKHIAEAIHAMVEGPVSAWCPASALQMHPATVVIVDEAAASGLTNPDFFKHIEAQNQALLARLTA